MVVTSPTAPALPGELVQQGDQLSAHSEVSSSVACPRTLRVTSCIRFQLEENG
jgi:hypothetical protein